MLINLARGWRPLLRIPDASQLRLGDRTEVFEEWIRSPVALTDAPPEIAVIVAVPDCAPARKVTFAMPLESVSASDG